MAIGNKGQALEEFQNQLVNVDGGSNTSLGVILADFRHAAKIFGSNAFANAPKNKFLFHVYFEINTAAYIPSKPEESNLIGILVRDVKLPSYTFTTHQLNQYNRKRIVQTKIKYDPVNFTFHDDMSNTIAKMWAAYYTYYYADGSQPAVLFSGNSGNATSAILATPSGGQPQVSTLTNYQLRTQYVPSTALPNPNNWGYIGDTNIPSATDYAKAPFFKNITIFGLMRHDFLAYTLINPVITQFAHDTYNYDEGNGVMKNTMTVDYETVVYNEGRLDGLDPGNIVTGFGQEDTYDRVPSPITREETRGYVVTDQGVVPGTPGGTVESLRRPSVENPNPNFGPTTTSYSLPKNPDTDSSGEVNAQLQNAEENSNNGTRNMLASIPAPSVSPGPAGLASSPAITPSGNPPTLDPINIPPFSLDPNSIVPPNNITYGSGRAGAPQTAGVQVAGVQPFIGGGGAFGGGGASGSW
jgi:uncharacterized membrane protein YgcG